MKTFTISGYDEGGIVRSKEKQMNVRLVCVTDRNEKIAIWGTDTEEYTNIKNVTDVDNEVQSKGFPCNIECVTRNPSDWAKRQYDHNYWIEENDHLKII